MESRPSPFPRQQPFIIESKQAQIIHLASGESYITPGLVFTPPHNYQIK